MSYLIGLPLIPPLALTQSKYVFAAKPEELELSATVMLTMLPIGIGASRWLPAFEAAVAGRHSHLCYAEMARLGFDHSRVRTQARPMRSSPQLAVLAKYPFTDALMRTGLTVSAHRSGRTWRNTT